MFYSLVINWDSIYYFLGSVLGSLILQDTSFTPFIERLKLPTPFNGETPQLRPFLLQATCYLLLLLKGRSQSRPLRVAGAVHALLVGLDSNDALLLTPHANDAFWKGSGKSSRPLNAVHAPWMLFTPFRWGGAPFTPFWGAFTPLSVLSYMGTF